MSFLNLINSIAAFPQWLESFDALKIPAWAVMLSIAIGLVGFVFAIREFLSWFLKTNSIVDEVIRLEKLVRDLQGDLNSLETTVARMQSTALLPSEEPAEATEKPAAPAIEEPARKARLFRLDN